MNLAAYALTERAVYELVASERALAGELLGDDDRLVVPLAVRAHFDLRAIEATAYQVFDFPRIHPEHP